jgi:hypothetical protein
MMANPTQAKLFEARKRAERFQNCFKYASTSDAPTELKERILNESDGSFLHTMQTIKTQMVGNMKERGMFPASGKCGFNPEKVDITSAAAGDNPDRLLSSQLFGEGCETIAAVAYRSSRTQEEQKLFDAESLILTEQLKARLGTLTQEEVSQVSRHLEQSVNTELAKVDPSRSSMLESASALPVVVVPPAVATGAVSMVPAIIILSFFAVYMVFFLHYSFCQIGE